MKILVLLISVCVGSLAHANASQVSTKVTRAGVLLQMEPQNISVLAPALQQQMNKRHSYRLNFRFPAVNCALSKVKNDTQNFSCVNRPQVSPATLVIEDRTARLATKPASLMDFSLVPALSNELSVNSFTINGKVKDIDNDGDAEGDDDQDGR